MVVLRDSDVLDDKVPVRIRSHPVPKRSALFLCYSRLLLEPRHRDMILMFSRAGPHAWPIWGNAWPALYSHPPTPIEKFEAWAQESKCQGLDFPIVMKRNWYHSPSSKKHISHTGATRLPMLVEGLAWCRELCIDLLACRRTCLRRKYIVHELGFMYRRLVLPEVLLLFSFKIWSLNEVELKLSGASLRCSSGWSPASTLPFELSSSECWFGSIRYFLAAGSNGAHVIYMAFSLLLIKMCSLSGHLTLTLNGRLLFRFMLFQKLIWQQ